MSSVLVQAAEIVRPDSCEHVESKKVLLSTLGHFAWFIQYRTRFIFFRHPQGDKSFDELVQHLKASLRKVLVDFYPIAGRLIVRDDGRMELDQQGQGICFAQAQAAHVSLDELGDENFDGVPLEFLLQLSQTGVSLQWPWPADAPLFFIQVTRFSCGGICIAIRFSHQAMDGTSAWHFVQAWAETCCGKDISLKPQLVDLPIPIIPPPSNDSDEQQQLQQELDELSYLKLYRRESLCTSEDLSSGKDHITRSFTFSKEFIAECKRQQPGFSTFQLLTSLIWHKITVARDYLDPEDSSTLHFAINCRERVTSIPRNYLGEGAVIASATMKVKLLRANRQNAASVLKEAIESFTEKKAALYVKLVEKFAGDKENSVFLRGSGSGRDVRVSSSFYFPVYQDFGFGKPDGITILPTPSDGKLCYFPGRAQGSVVVYVSGTSAVMDRLSSGMLVT